jgi:multiple sugar transport system permease protein
MTTSTVPSPTVVTGRPRRTRRPESGLRIDRPRGPGAALSYAVLILMFAYFLLPFWWLVVAATKSNDGLFSSPALWFADNGLFDNLHQLFTFQDGIYLRWMLNSAFYAAVGGVGATAVSALAGYAFAKLRFPGRNLLFNVLLGLVMVPATALVLPTYLMLSNVGLVDSIWSVILPTLLNPFGVYLFRVYANDMVPEEMLEAARIDGASEIRIFRSVALPVMRPALVTVLLFSIVATWNNFFLPLVMLSNDRLFPLTVGLRTWYRTATINSGASVLFNLVIVGSLLAIIPLVAAFLMLQRYWQGGLTVGSIK